MYWKITNFTNPMLGVRGAGSVAVGKLNLSGACVDYVEKIGWGTDVYQDDAESLKEQSGECVTADDFDKLCKINTETNSKAIDGKESEELNAERVSEMRKRKRMVSLNPTVN